MSAFPTLKTGAVMQYPGQRVVKFSTVAVQFLDGSEQRFNNFPGALHQWVIRLTLLDQSEVHQLQEFVREMEGSAQDFTFTDPWDGTTYASCSFGSDTMTAILAGEWNGQTSLTVQENGNGN